uniref:RNA helicase n=1 Tax=Glossina palpalis gambiensis TaxID=67801 RepID=A0A1B0AKR4_9MUSC
MTIFGENQCFKDFRQRNLQDVVPKADRENHIELQIYNRKEYYLKRWFKCGIDGAFFVAEITTQLPNYNRSSVVETSGVSKIKFEFHYGSSRVRHALGFIQNGKLTNLAMSRCLLVMYGNPDLLFLDRSWHAIIKYCVDNDGYIGDLPATLSDPTIKL